MKSIRLNFSSHVVFALLLLAFVVSQVCFLEADPDISMATGSRAAWTDDGILLCQVKNFLNGHGFQLMESDGFLKAPFFSFVQGVAMAVFGTDQVVVRTVVMVLVLVPLCLLLFDGKSKLLGIIMTLTTCLLIPVHQHTHLALAEMAAVSFVLLAGFFLVKYFHESKAKWVILSQSAILFAIGMKIQFIYLVMLPVLCWWVVTKTSDSLANMRTNHTRMVLSSVIASFVLLMIYFMVFKEEWIVFQQAQSGSLLWDSISWDSFRNNCLAYLFRKKMILFVLLFLISLVIFCNLIFNKNRRGVISVWSIFSLFWFLLELHKLPMDYLPMRYMVSFYMAMGLFSSAMLVDLWFASLFPRIRALSFGLLALVSMVNVYVLARACSERTYQLKSIQERIVVGLKQDDVVVGPWAPALTWGSKCRSFPVWSGFSSPDQIKRSGFPTVVVSEKGGLDSDFDWTVLLGRELEVVADSISNSNIADWRVGVYWLNH